MYMSAPSLPILAAYIQLTLALTSPREVARALGEGSEGSGGGAVC
jgi:hypothetical protein